MIKKYSTYFASFAAIIVFIEGLFVNLSYQALAIRTILVFCVFYILGNMLGVITIEALLENQVMKSARKKAAAKKETNKSE